MVLTCLNHIMYCIVLHMQCMYVYETVKFGPSFMKFSAT